MIQKSGYRFSEKIMLDKNVASQPTKSDFKVWPA
jgi:hypothetical protein